MNKVYVIVNNENKQYFWKTVKGVDQFTHELEKAKKYRSRSTALNAIFKLNNGNYSVDEIHYVYYKVIEDSLF